MRRHGVEEAKEANGVWRGGEEARSKEVRRHGGEGGQGVNGGCGEEERRQAARR